MLQQLTYVVFTMGLLAGVSFGQSQIGGATLSGTVTDAMGAAVSGSKVTATQTSTGLVRTTDTSDAGLYSFSSLPAGAYDVAYEKAGIKLDMLATTGFTMRSYESYAVNSEVSALVTIR